MFGFRKNNGLPMAQNSPYRGKADGSGRGIRMEAPISRAWRNSSGFTKGTYYSLIINIGLVFFGFRRLRSDFASIWLTCKAQQCELEITPPGRMGTIKVEFARAQLAQAQAIKVDAQNNFIQIDDRPIVYPSHATSKAKTIYRNKGPDANGHYDSYWIMLRPGGSPEHDLSALEPFSDRNEENQYYRFMMRQFNLGHSKRRTKTLVTRIDSYLQHRRHDLNIKETSSLGWQGILSLVLGLFGLLLTLVAGQFFETSSTSIGGPGARRRARLQQQHQQQKRQYATSTSQRRRRNVREVKKGY